MDICQSVLRSFFLRAAAGQYDLGSPEKVLGLLTAMARNKLASQARRQRSQRRGGHHVAIGDEGHERLVAPGTGPGGEAALRDLLQEVRRRLSPDERRLLELRNQGHDWPAIAAELGGGAGALRQKLTRALDRVAGELGLDDPP